MPPQSSQFSLSLASVLPQSLSVHLSPSLHLSHPQSPFSPPQSLPVPLNPPKSSLGPVSPPQSPSAPQSSLSPPSIFLQSTSVAPQSPSVPLSPPEIPSAPLCPSHSLRHVDLMESSPHQSVLTIDSVMAWIQPLKNDTKPPENIQRGPRSPRIAPWRPKTAQDRPGRPPKPPTPLT